MRKLGWYALRVTVVAFVLGGLLLLAANLYVQSHGVQQRIRAAVEGNLKMPVQLQKTTVTPWEGLRLDGVVLRPEEPDADSTSPRDRPPDFFSASSFRVRFALWPLVAQQRVEIERVLLDKPRIVWQQDDDGHWSFPPGQDQVRLAEAKELARENAAAVAPVPAAGVPGAKPGVPTPESQATPTPGSLPAVEKSAARGSRSRALKRFSPVDQQPEHPAWGVDIPLDRDHRQVARLEEINSDGAITDPHHLKGAVWFAKAAASSSGAALTDYWTAVDFSDENGVTIAVRDGHGKIAGVQCRRTFGFNRNRRDQRSMPGASSTVSRSGN